MTSSVVGPRRSSKALPKAKFVPPPKKNHGHCLVVFCWSDPLQLLNLSKTITSESNSKLMRCTKNCNTCSRHWSTKRAQFSPWQRSTAHGTTSASKVKWIGLQSFASSALFTWPLPNWLPFFLASRQLFAWKMLPQLAGHRKYFPKVYRILKHVFLCHRNKQTYFSLTKMCWL